MSNGKLWGGAFDKAPHSLAWEFGQSVVSDCSLYREEIDVSIAHAEMLGTRKILKAAEVRRLVAGLKKIRKLIESDGLVISDETEDIHSMIEQALTDELGEAASKLHIGRSRNDQIATVTRLWLVRRIDELHSAIKKHQKLLLNLAAKHAEHVMPGYTHQQVAQPITLGYHLLAYFWMLQRDGWRLDLLRELCSVSPLGSAALAGTPFSIDREQTATAIGFSAPTPSALDGVSDRDFVGDALHACSMIMQHLSRLSQEIILWTTAEFQFMRLDDSLSTGSSIMPQKRNPDFAELIRGRSAKAVANWVQYQAMMKALPMGYNRDMQDDKPPLFDSVELTLASLELSCEMLRSATFDLKRLEEASDSGYSTATGIADLLASKGTPFREAHAIVGKFVRECEKRGVRLSELKPSDLAMLAPHLPQELLEGVQPKANALSRTSEGGPSPLAFGRQLRRAEKLHKRPGFDKFQ